MNEQQIAAVLEMNIQLSSEISALRDLVAVLIAERANQSGDPMRALDRFIEDERNAVYRAVASDDVEMRHKDRIRQIKAEVKEGVFTLARGIVASPDR